MFPGETEAQIQTRLTAYIKDAEDRIADLVTIGVNSVVRAWAYHRAFDAASILLDTKASTISFADQGSRSFMEDQIKSMRNRSVEYLKEFERLVTAAAAPVAVRSSFPITQTVRTDIQW